jgi:hypothetical protein
MSDWRTIQVFLSPRHPAVYEVELNIVSGEPRCSCPTYRAKDECRHVKAIRDRMAESGGQYPIVLNERAEVGQMLFSETVVRDPEKFRDMVLRFGKVEVL